jgi:hypothetical protein
VVHARAAAEIQQRTPILEALDREVADHVLPSSDAPIAGLGSACTTHACPSLTELSLEHTRLVPTPTP